MLDLLEEERNDRAARGEHVAVAGAHEARLPAGEVGLDEDPFLQCFGHAHDVHRFARLVRGDADDALHRKPEL